MLFSVSIICSNYCPLPQVEAANTVAFKYFWQLSPRSQLFTLGKFWVKWNKGKPFELVLQGSTRQVKTHNHNSLVTDLLFFSQHHERTAGMQASIFKITPELGRSAGAKVS